MRTCLRAAAVLSWLLLAFAPRAARAQSDHDTPTIVRTLPFSSIV